MTVRKIAERYGSEKSGSEVTHKLALLTLSATIKNLLTCVSKNIFGERHAYEISKLCHPAELLKFFEDNKEFLENNEIEEKWEDMYDKEIVYQQSLQIKLAENVINNEWTVKRLEKDRKKKKGKLLKTLYKSYHFV